MCRGGRLFCPKCRSPYWYADLWAAALQTAIARRSGDTGAVQKHWYAAMEVLAEYSVDLFALLPLGELWVAAARMRQPDRLRHPLDQAFALLESLGNPPLWSVPLHWAGVHAGILANVTGAVAPHGQALTAAAARQRVRQGAGGGRPDVAAGAGRPGRRRRGHRGRPALAQFGLTSDATRLAGQAALQTSDGRGVRCHAAAGARPEVASAGEAAADAPGELPDGARTGGHRSGGRASPGRSPLSDREREVAELLLLGMPYRDIGGQLFISAKTVEHHVARIRRRLGAESRSEMLSMLRAMLARSAAAAPSAVRAAFCGESRTDATMSRAKFGTEFSLSDHGIGGRPSVTHADAHQAGVGPGLDRGRGGVRLQRVLVAVQADHVRPAGRAGAPTTSAPGSGRSSPRSSARRKLLKWSIPGLAHFFTMWGFFILVTVYLEAYGALFQPNFHIPIVGRWDALGFLQDFIALAVLAGIITFAIIRLRSEPKEYGRALPLLRLTHRRRLADPVHDLPGHLQLRHLPRRLGQHRKLPLRLGARSSPTPWARCMHPLGTTANEWIETIALLAHIAVALIFLLIVLHSKHLHIFLAPINVTFKRLPDGLGPLLPVESKGKPIDFEDPAEDAVFGRGKIEDFTWKGMLDFATCTECGRCQSQCPAWNTGKPLSPKLVIMDLRDHLMAKAPYILGDKTRRAARGSGPRDGPSEEGHHVPESGFGRIPGHGPEQAARPLVGTAEQGGVIDPDVLWSCTTCGACVEQCPVDIEHIDHIVDMRRYQVMMESEFPTELSALFKNLENKGNPWGQNASDRTNWIDEVDFDVPVYGEDVDSFDGFEYLFWVGCAGAYDDQAKKTTKAVAELLAVAG